MIVFKFGGASVKNADAVKNLKSILERYNEKIVVVISAMGKTTNALEKLCNDYFYEKIEKKESLQIVKEFHLSITNELFDDKNHQIFNDLDLIFADLYRLVGSKPSVDYSSEYDKIVSFGEIVSTKIIAAYLNYKGNNCEFVDIRSILKTDDTFQEGKVNWKQTNDLMSRFFTFTQTNTYITQGFIGSTSNGRTTTLGREGSDFTAAIIAHSLHAESVTIWKDVDGVLNADPKWFDNTEKLDIMELQLFILKP